MKKGFTLVEIMIVVAVIAALVGIAIPNLLRSRLNANEHYAISNLQTISVAAQTYWSVKNTLPTALTQLHDEGYIDDTLGYAASGCTKNGYTYYIGGTGLTTDFFVYTVPQTSSTGVRSFCSGSDGVTRVSPSGATPASQTACNAWASL
ncbi:MAG: prepilin-type N-terminal cleavage/methylation domain-containing protein [Candidatus Omnitrophica bacterium]|nr:prepilin-type N-terminal cleavage/methylation domain-containing protein [Candidatus Omnitrophota bacterium]